MTSAMSQLLKAARLALLLPAMSLSANPHPTTRKHPVTNEYHGIIVTDDYQWLEAAQSPEVKEWTERQNRHSRDWFDARPVRNELEAKLHAMYAKDTPSHAGITSRSGRLFALKFQPPKQQRLLVTLSSPDDLASEKVILDPNEIEPKGQVAMDWYVPSPDGRLIAVCLSENGSEDGSLHFFRTETGERLPDRIPRVQYPTGGGSAAWLPDGSGIFYTRYPHPGERPDADLNFFQKIYFHQLGTPPNQDSLSTGDDFPRIAETDLHASEDGNWILASVANGDGGEFSHHLRSTKPESPWRQITRHEDGIKEVTFSHDGKSLYLRSVKDAPRGRLLHLKIDESLDSARLAVAQGDAVIERIIPTAKALYLVEMVGGPSRIRECDHDGTFRREIPLPVATGVSGTIEHNGNLLFRQSSFVAPSAWLVYHPDSGTTQPTALRNSSPVDFSDIEAIREFAVSRDGTRVPINILKKKGTPLDGNNPTLLYGYGGYGHCMRPGFNFENRIWFDHGGIHVIANLRGGGEYGEQWHLAGNLTHKQNVFDDFAACATHLIERGYTRAEKLAVEGGSNGGLLMGAFLTQNPHLARAVVAHVGIFDMLRVELDPNGAFNITEFGTVKNLDQFKALHAYSPFHRVKEGTAYPAVFLLAGETDGRVNPAHSRRMAARLQAASNSGRPILARFSASSGHGMGTGLSERIAQKAEVLTFLLDQLEVAPR